jgi:hypothetical protein
MRNKGEATMTAVRMLRSLLTNITLTMAALEMMTGTARISMIMDLMIWKVYPSRYLILMYIDDSNVKEEEEHSPRAQNVQDQRIVINLISGQKTDLLD